MIFTKGKCTNKRNSYNDVTKINITWELYGKKISLKNNNKMTVRCRINYTSIVVFLNDYFYTM